MSIENVSGQSWNDARQSYPHQWVVIEALAAHSKDDKRIVEALNVVDTFQDSEQALRRYLALHRENHQRELYVVHTDRESLDITEQKWVGIRTA